MPLPVLVYTRIAATKRDTRLQLVLFLLALLPAVLTTGIPAPDASKLLAKLKKRGLTTSERPRWNLPLDDARRSGRR